MEKVLIILVSAISGLFQGRENFELPMSIEEKHSPSVLHLYAKPGVIASNNPRFILSKAQFELGTAQLFGLEIKPNCTQIEGSPELFDNFKAETKYSPKRVKNHAIGILNNCK